MSEKAEEVYGRLHVGPAHPSECLATGAWEFSYEPRHEREWPETPLVVLAQGPDLGLRQFYVPTVMKV